MRVLSENRWQARKVRWLTWGLAAYAAGFVYWAWSLSQTFGLLPGDGGILRPLHERLTVAGIVALVGLLPTAGMWLFNRRYLIRIERDGDAVALTTIGLLFPATRTFRAGDFTGTGYHRGRASGRISVNAPWTALRVAGFRVPFVVDMQAEHVDLDAITALGPEPQAPQAPRSKPVQNKRRRATNLKRV